MVWLPDGLRRRAQLRDLHRAGRVWYAVLPEGKLPKDADFATFADLTEEAAGRLFGPTERDAVRDAWAKVGVPTG